MSLTYGPEDVRPLFVFLQDLSQFATEGNLTDIFQEDGNDLAHQVQQPGDADKVTKLDHGEVRDDNVQIGFSAD